MTYPFLACPKIVTKTGLDSVEESSQSIISTMAAFGVESNNTMSIIDKFNAVGNNFSITSAGIGEALQRSAAALAESGNSIDESIALVTAGNAVIQNPEQVGTALKTLALRLRATKVELEAAGEDVDGMAESTSQLQAKLKALTDGKVDIMLNADSYKNPTEILREMASAWKDMTDIERSGALELMGGKRQANILASIINNFETVEDVIETSMNSSGSAIAENEKWLDSIEGKTYQFTNALQTMWSNMLNSEMIKGFIDFGTGAVKILDTLAGKAVAIVAAFKLLAKYKGFSLGGLKKGLGDNIKAIITAQQTLQAMSKAAPVTGVLSTDSVNAYAKAVEGLTAKQQASFLASQNLTKTDIQRVLQINKCTEAEQREALAHVRTTTTKKQEAEAAQALFVAKTQEVAESYKAQAAKLMEAGATETDTAVTEANTVATILEKAASEDLTKAKLYELIMSSELEDQTKQEIIAKLALTKENNKLIGSIKGLKGATGALMSSNPVGWIMTIVGAIFAITSAIGMWADKVKEAREEAASNASDLKSSIGGLDDYTDQIIDLRNKLNQLNLTEEDAYGYKKELIQIQDELIDKYGKEAEGINVVTGAINDQIAAIKELGKKEYNKFVQDNIEEIEDATDFFKPQDSSIYSHFIKGTTHAISLNDMGESMLGITTDKEQNELAEQFVDQFIQEANKAGISFKDDADHGAFTMFDDIEISGTPDEQLESWNKIYDIITNIGKDMFGENYINQVSNVLGHVSDRIEDVSSQIETNRTIFDQYVAGLLEYDSQYSEFYSSLMSAQKEYDNALLSGDAQAIDLARAQMDVLQESLKLDDSNPMFDNDAVNIYFKSFFDTWNKLAQQNQFKIDVEINKDGISDGINDALQHFDNDLGILNTKEHTDEQKKQYAVLQSYADKYGLSIDDLVRKLVELGHVQGEVFSVEQEATNIQSVKTISELEEKTSSYYDILSQTSEIVTDNTEVTQEYKDSLIELGVSEEELAECFDENNDLIVKNAKALNNLVKATSKNIANNVKLAKSQARLEYYDLVKQLNSALDGTKKLDSAARDSVYSTIAQIDAVQKAIYQYQLLEDTLLGVNNAFKEFNEAKEIDDLNTYGDSYVEMVQTMYDGLYKTGKVGTEQFWAAVENLVPTEVYQGLKEDSDRMKAIYDYYNKKILPSLHLEEDQFSMDYASIENFVKKAIDAKVFTGDRKDFDLVEGMNLEEAAKRLEMTKTQAYAFFAELDKYNTSSTEPSFLSQLDDSLEGRITKVTNKIEDLNKQKLALLEDGGYDKNEKAIKNIDKQIKEAGGDLESLGQEAYTTWQNYTKNDAAIASIEEISDKSQTLSDVWPEELITSLGLTGEMTVEEAYNRLLQKQLKLEEPTVLTAQLAIENIDIQIANLEAKLKKAEEDPTVLGVKVDASDTEVEAAKQKVQDQIQALQEDKVAIATTYNIELSEEDKETLQDELNAIEKFKIHDKEFTVVAKGTSEVMRLLEAVNQYAKDVTKTVTTEYKTVYTSDNKQYSGWTHTPGSGGRYTHANGTAHATGSWGAPRTETALVGELGPELLVRNGRWHTIGENGAEFTQVQRGDIIFNHKQTEDLLSNGYVTGRGKLQGGSSAFASGTAYSGIWRPTSQNKEQSNKPGNDFTETGNRLFNAADSLSSAAGSMSDTADEFREVFDWIEVRLEEINESIDLRNAQLENEIGHANQNKVVDSMIDLNQKLYDNLIAGANKYYAYSERLLTKVPKAYRDAAQDGTIAIEEFIGEVDEKTLEAIQDYREWVQKGADLTQQAEETLTEISNLAKQAIDNIASDYENKKSLSDNKIDQYDAYNALLETDKGFESTAVYQAMIAENNKNIATLQQQRDKMQAELNKRVQSGEIKKYSQDWYDAVNDIAAVDTEIIELTTDTENYQDAINELHWDKFDALMKRIELVSDETENLIDILSNKDVVDEGGVWTEEGITSLGLYAQQMEAAEVQAKKYEEEIKYLNKNWQKLGYTEEEYIDKLDELKSGQYDAIKAYHDSKDAIVDLNKERVDAIKEGIEKEIEAYEELIEKKKEELDAEKDLFDFQKSIRESSKNIADLERQLAALSADNSASARAKRAQLEAELAEANQELQDKYYDRSVTNQQEALDKELENLRDEKDAEMEALDEYLEKTEQVVADSLETIQANTDVVYQTLQGMVQEYGLDIQNSITSAIIDPWSEGSTAIQSFSEQFGVSMSETVEELEQLAIHFKETMLEIEQAGVNATNAVGTNAQGYTNAEYQAPKKEEPKKDDNKKQEDQKTIKVGGKINAGSAKIYDYVGDKSGAKQYYAKDPIYVVLEEKNGYLRVRHHKSSKGTTGWFKKSDVKAYAKGSTGVDKDQLAWIDELGDELQLVPDGNGRLEYIKKGTGIVPADLTKRLIGIAMDPQGMLDSNRPTISPHQSIVNNNMEISVDASVGTLLHVDHLDGNNPEEVLKLVDKAWDKKMQGLNNAIKKFTR
jgi:TP901 family phage tail tape measure protein